MPVTRHRPTLTSLLHCVSPHICSPAGAVARLSDDTPKIACGTTGNLSVSLSGDGTEYAATFIGVTSGNLTVHSKVTAMDYDPSCDPDVYTALVGDGMVPHRASTSPVD